MSTGDDEINFRKVCMLNKIYNLYKNMRRPEEMSHINSDPLLIGDSH